eukprot:jgi/Botrbrau1/17989/Bobra.0460s0005.1
MSQACIQRLQKEYKALLKDPIPNIRAHPCPSNLLEWHYVLEGAEGTEYEGGVYHGKIIFPAQYPFQPPSLQMLTPSGRFATKTKLCLSMTDFHPESWNPLWSVGTILSGLLSFMYDNAHTTGSISSTKEDKIRLAAASLDFNVKNPTFCRLFPEYVEEKERKAAAAHQEQPRPEVQQDNAAPPAQRPLHPPGGSVFGTLAISLTVLAVMMIPFLSQLNQKG